MSSPDAASTLFVALWLPDDVARAVQTVLDPVRERFPRVRWQTRDRWHVTIAYLGERTEPATLRRFERLPLAEASPISLAGAGSFGPVAWVGVQDDGWLGDLAVVVRARLGAVERRPFRAHVTVGRVRDPGGVPTALVDVLRTVQAPPWIPTELALVRSTAGPSPSYRQIASKRFRFTAR